LHSHFSPMTYLSRTSRPFTVASDQRSSVTSYVSSGPLLVFVFALDSAFVFAFAFVLALAFVVIVATLLSTSCTLPLRIGITLEEKHFKMSSTHVFRVQDVCARLTVNVASALETPVSPSDKESGPKSGTGVLPLASPQTGSDPTLVDLDPRIQVSLAEACNNQKVVTQSNWQCPSSPTIPSPFPLDLVYELWNTYVSDEEESGIVLSLESSIDGDIFGVGKRPVQREIEKDGCIQLVFVEE